MDTPRRQKAISLKGADITSCCGFEVASALDGSGQPAILLRFLLDSEGDTTKWHAISFRSALQLLGSVPAALETAMAEVASHVQDPGEHEC